MEKLNWCSFVWLRAEIIINDRISSICTLATAMRCISAHRTGDRDIHEQNHAQRLRYPDWAGPMTMFSIHKLLNSIIVIAHCFACALVALAHVYKWTLHLLFFSLCLSEFYYFNFIFFIDSFVRYLKSFGLIELRVQRLLLVLHQTNACVCVCKEGMERTDEKTTRMEECTKKDFVSAFWANCLIRFNKKPERWIVFVVLWITADCMKWMQLLHAVIIMCTL